MEKGLVTTGNYENILTNLVRIYVTYPHVKQGFLCSSLQRNVSIHEAHFTFHFFPKNKIVIKIVHLSVISSIISNSFALKSSHRRCSIRKGVLRNTSGRKGVLFNRTPPDDCISLH